MKETINHFEGHRGFHFFVRATYYDLEQLKKEAKKAPFNELVIKITPEVKRYVEKNLKAIKANGKMDAEKYKADDFIDQLFIEAYDNFDTIGNKENLHPWLFKKVDDLLGDIFLEDGFNTFFYEHIDKYSKPEWNTMEKAFGAYLEGNSAIIEALDDFSYRKCNYVLNHIFIDNDNVEFATHLENELGAANILKHSEMVLLQLPYSIRTVFELFAEYQFDLEDIAKIRKCSIKEVLATLQVAHNILQTSFIKRYKP